MDSPDRSLCFSFIRCAPALLIGVALKAMFGCMHQDIGSKNPLMSMCHQIFFGCVTSAPDRSSPEATVEFIIFDSSLNLFMEEITSTPYFSSGVYPFH